MIFGGSSLHVLLSDELQYVFAFYDYCISIPKELKIVCEDAINRSIKINMIEFFLYNMKFELGEGAWQVCK